MFVYQPGTRGRRTMFVRPGSVHPVSDWLDEDGKPIQFSIQFVEGRAEVADNLGRYLIDNQMASSSPIILP